MVKVELNRYWAFGGSEQDIAHEIYHDDALLEFSESSERFVGVENFRERRRFYHASLAFEIRKIRGRDDLCIAEKSISYDEDPGTSRSVFSSSEATRCPGDYLHHAALGTTRVASAVEICSINADPHRAFAADVAVDTICRRGG